MYLYSQNINAKYHIHSVGYTRCDWNQFYSISLLVLSFSQMKFSPKPLFIKYFDILNISLKKPKGQHWNIKQNIIQDCLSVTNVSSFQNVANSYHHLPASLADCLNGKMQRNCLTNANKNSPSPSLGYANSCRTSRLDQTSCASSSPQDTSLNCSTTNNGWLAPYWDGSEDSGFSTLRL